MKNGKVSSFDVTQWSKLVKSHFKKKSQLCFEKDQARVLCWNFSFLAWKRTNLVFLMLHSGQNWSKVILKKNWPLCYEKDQARVLWWKFQFSGMKKGKVSIFDVTQWSKLVKSHFEKNLTNLFWKKLGKGSVLKISAC